jgi:hypothetical protein
LVNVVDKGLPTLLESHMSSNSGISGISSANAPQQVSKTRTTDADGDVDGTKATEKPPAQPTPQVSKPTETKGNHVNTTA